MAYKVYAETVRERLEKWTKRKELLPESQEGFRRERGTVDNVFILNHLVQRERRKENNKVYVVFADIKAAFDNVRREKLWEILIEKGIDGTLIERLRSSYKKMRTTVKIKKGLTNEFVTRKGVRQGCVLSLLLFSLYVADVDRYIARRGIGGVALGKDRTWSLAYADDMALAKNREALEDEYF